MIAVVFKEDENLDKGINRFKKKVITEGILSEVKKREYFQKPSKLKHERNKSVRRKQIKQLKKVNTTDY